MPRRHQFYHKTPQGDRPSTTGSQLETFTYNCFNPVKLTRGWTEQQLLMGECSPFKREVPVSGSPFQWTHRQHEPLGQVSVQRLSKFKPHVRILIFKCTRQWNNNHLFRLQWASSRSPGQKAACSSGGRKAFSQTDVVREHLRLAQIRNKWGHFRNANSCTEKTMKLHEVAKADSTGWEEAGTQGKII